MQWQDMYVDYYEYIGEIMGMLEAMELEVEEMVLNKNCESGNRYLREAAIEMNGGAKPLREKTVEIKCLNAAE